VDVASFHWLNRIFVPSWVGLHFWPRVDMFIIEQYLITERFQIFQHFLTNLKFFNVIGSAKQKATNVF